MPGNRLKSFWPAWRRREEREIREELEALRAIASPKELGNLTLALAIGANSAIFSFADALLLRPLPVAHPFTLFDITNSTPDNPFEGMSYPDYRDLGDHSRSFTGMAAYRITALAAATNPNAPAQIRRVMLMSGNLMTVAGVAPLAG